MGKEDQPTQLPSGEEFHNFLTGQAETPAEGQQPEPGTEPTAAPEESPPASAEGATGEEGKVDDPATEPTATDPTAGDAEARLAAMERKHNELLGHMGTLTNHLLQLQQTTQQQTEQEPEPEPEPEIDFKIPKEIPEEFAERLDALWVENPAQAVAEVTAWQQRELLKAQRAREQQEQQKQERQQQALEQGFREGYAALSQQHGREVVEQHSAQIEELLIKQRPELLQLPPHVALDVAFNMVHGAQASSQAPKTPQATPTPKTPDTAGATAGANALLEQPEIRQSAKDALRKEIIEEYLAGVKKGNVPPQVMSGQPGGATQVTPPERPKTLDDSMKLWMHQEGLKQ